ncbi:hypothetical protein Hanom_Chr17g01553451 [Helianthus anomalus]
MSFEDLLLKTGFQPRSSLGLNGKSEENGIVGKKKSLEEVFGFTGISFSSFTVCKSGWALGFLTRTFAMLRNRLLADLSVIFKIGTEVFCLFAFFFLCFVFEYLRLVIGYCYDIDSD